ncbi:MAG: T9SS type A sorting domain-containing protein [Cytophagales bacterium]|nr:T9SS type A sorting domain-containing protein [Cytophagales bacterium]
MCWGQTTYTQNFDTPGNWTGGTMGSYTTDKGYWQSGQPVVFSCSNGALRQNSATQDGFPATRSSSTHSWRLEDSGTGSWRALITTGGVGTFSLYVRRWDNSPNPSYICEYSINNGSSYTSVQTIDNTWLGSSDWKQVSGVINTNNTSGLSSDDIIIRIRRVSGERLMIDDFEMTDYASAGCTAPTTQAVASAATSVTSTTSTLNWVRGNGNNLLVILRPTAASNATPTNGTGYVPNTQYGLGNTISGPNFSVYTGTGTSVAITGLTPSTQYTMVVYEYNDTGICYETTTISSVNFTTSAPPASVITLSSPSQIGAGNVVQAANNHIASNFQAAVTVSNTTLTALAFTLGNGGGTYNATNLGNLRLWYNGTSNTFGSAVQIGSTISAAPAVGVAATFTGLTQVINSGSTGYFWITTSISGTAVIGNTFNIVANPIFTFVGGNTTGSITAGGNQTIIAAPSAETDVVSVTGSEAVSISSIINTSGPLTSVQGTQVWQFTIRDGGADLTDSDNYASIVTHIRLAQGTGNAVNTWNTAIQAVDLFDGTTHLASGIVTASNISFTGSPLVTVADGTSKTLSVRLTVKNPLPSDAPDGDDFVFSLSNANITLSGTGSGTSSFPFIQSVNDQNAISVVATLLTITGQASSVAVNNAMSPSVVFKAVDANGNVDIISSGSVTIFSTGTLSGTSTNSATFAAGLATFSNIRHSVIGSNFVLYSTNTISVTNATTTSFNVLETTNFESGDLAILAMNSNISGGNEEFSFIIFKDLVVGTSIDFTDNGYERQNNDEWGDTEGAITLTRTGSTLAAGTVITIEAIGNAEDDADFNIYVGGVNDDANWTIGESLNMTAGAGFNMNNADEIWMMQGGTWTNPAGNHNAEYVGGNVLYGWTATDWDANLTADGSDRGTDASALYPGSNCFNTNVTGLTNKDKVKYTGPTSAASKITWILRLNNSANWTGYSSDANYNAGGTDYRGAGASYTITVSGFQDGVWTGTRSNDWFDCGNWQSLTLPDRNIDVTFDANASQNAHIRYNSSLAGLANSIAGCNNLYLFNQEINLEGSPLNKLHINGGITIAGTGTLDISDGTAGTPDGSLTLTGDWVNFRDESEFKQGESTVFLNPSSTQSIRNPISGQETFYNIVHLSAGTTNLLSNIILENNLSILGTGSIDAGTRNLTGVGVRMNSGTLLLAQSAAGTNFVPSFTNFTLNGGNIHFYGANNQSVKGNIPYANVAFINSGLKTVSGSHLIVNGNLTVNGNYLPRFETISVTGTNVSVTGTTSLVVSALGIGASSTVHSTNIGTILGSITIGNSGRLNVVGNALTLRSTSDQTARIAQSGTNATITGSVVAERYVHGVNRQNMVLQLAPSVQGGIVRDWQGSSSTTGIYITGAFGWKSNPGAWTGISSSAGASMFIYNASTPDYEAYPPRNIGSNLYVLTPRTGYRLFVRDGTTTAGFNTVVPKVLTIVGYPLFGTQSYNIAYNAAQTNSGWNFIGNPYHCEINGNLQDATSWTRTGIGAAIYLWNSTLSSFNTYVDGVGLIGGSGSWNGRIPASQGFWIKATTTGAALSVMEAAKRSDQSTLWRIEQVPNLLNVAVYNSDEEDGILLRLREGATYAFDGDYDAEKLPSNFTGAAFTSLSIQNKNDHVLKYAINTIPIPDNSITDTFQLITKLARNTNPRISINNTSSFDTTFTFWLQDRYLHDTLVNATSHPYHFHIGTDSGSTLSTRFRLLLKYNKPIAIMTQPIVTVPSEVIEQDKIELNTLYGNLSGCQYSVYPNPVNAHTIKIKLLSGDDKNLKAKLFDLNGKCIVEKTYYFQSDTEILDVPSNIIHGYYLLEISNAKYKNIHKLKVE